jgi:hypothetical protein
MATVGDLDIFSSSSSSSSSRSGSRSSLLGSGFWLLEPVGLISCCGAGDGRKSMVIYGHESHGAAGFGVGGGGGGGG